VSGSTDTIPTRSATVPPALEWRWTGAQARQHTHAIRCFEQDAWKAHTNREELTEYQADAVRRLLAYVKRTNITQERVTYLVALAAFRAEGPGQHTQAGYDRLHTLRIAAGGRA
jgi:hypothetical protein